jgi:hypothetical protein
VRYANSEFETIDPATPQIGKWRQFRDIDYYFFSTKCRKLTRNLPGAGGAWKGKCTWAASPKAAARMQRRGPGPSSHPFAPDCRTRCGNPEIGY